MKKSTTLTIVVLVESIILMATAIGLDNMKSIFQGFTLTIIIGLGNLSLGFFLGRPPKNIKSKRGKAHPSPTPQRRAPLSKEQFKRAFDIEGPGWVRTGWKLFPPCSIFSLIQHFHIFLHLQISFVLGNYFSNLLLHLFFFG